MAMQLEGKSAVVTGSSRSLGKDMALALAENGANVVVNHRDSAADAEAVAKAIRAMGRRAIVIQADVTQQTQVKAMAEKALTEFGTIDILVNNVGTSTRVPFLDLTQKDWHQLISINLDSMFYCTQAFIKGMVEQKWGRIVNITGHAGLRGTPESAHVCAGKAGTEGFTRSIATEFARHGITCNVMAPGSITAETRHRYYRQMAEQIEGGERWYEHWRGAIAMGRPGTGKEFASLCVYLCSEDAGYLTGQTYLVNGGMMYH